MTHIFILLTVFILLVLILWVSVALGRHYGRLAVSNHSEHKLEVVGVAESAVFGLLALLIAFTFSGSYERFESRKMHIVHEANAFARAYKYVDLVQPKYHAILKRNISKYLELHLAAYNDIPYMDLVNQDLSDARQVRETIWKTIIVACEENANKTLSQIVIPSIFDMFESADTGIVLTKIHTPATIFVLLICLASLGAFLVGYNSTESKQSYPIHMICYVILTAITVFIIINIEYPRVGFIRLHTVDQMLIDVRSEMN